MSVDHNPFSVSADSAPAPDSAPPSDQSTPPNPPISPPFEPAEPPPSPHATLCNVFANDSSPNPQPSDPPPSNATLCNTPTTDAPPIAPPHDHPPIIDALNASLCNTPSINDDTQPTNPPDSNPVPPHRRGIYTFHPTPKISPRGTPILANQESDQAPFRTDSALAAVPVRMPDLSDDQLRAIQLTLDGYTDGSIARILKINRSTLWRWKNFHPLFKSELSRRRHEAWSAAGDRFRRTLFAALKHIRRQLADKSALTSFRAAKLLLNLAGANRFSPPDEPTDPQTYLDTFALARRKEIHSPNLESDPAHDSERTSALATLLARCEDPNLPPSGMQPDPKQVHPLGNDDDPNSAHGSD